MLPVPCVGTVTILGCVWHCCTLLLSVSHPKPDPIEPGEKHGSGLFVILWDTRRVCVSVIIYYCLFIYNCQGTSVVDLNLAFFKHCNWNFELWPWAHSHRLVWACSDPGVLQDNMNTPWMQEETFPIFLNSDRKAEAGHFTPADENYFKGLIKAHHKS